MNAGMERSRSPWMEIPAPAAARLGADLRTDVLVVGAGIAGLSTAFELAARGRQVAVVDRGPVGRGMSARTSAHLAFELDDYYREFARLRGRDAARQYYQSQSAAVDRIETLCAAEGIDCDFARVDGWFMPARVEDIDLLQEEIAAARDAGFTDATWVEDAGLPGWPGPGARFPRQARFHPTKYLDGLVHALERRGARIFDHSPVGNLEETDGGVRATTPDGHSIHARQVVVATNAPFHLRIPIHTKQAPYRTYVIAAPVPKGAAPDALVWDTAEPAYHYVRIVPGEDGDLLLVGGEDHKTGEADDMEARIRELAHWARARWPQLGEVRYQWSGQVMEPSDHAPMIGASPGSERIFIVTRDSGEGLTTAVAGSMLLADLLSGTSNRWQEVYDPGRLMTRGLTEYVKENVDDVRHFAAHLGRGEVRSPDEIRPGQGALLRRGAKLVAAYRHSDGRLTLKSAACTHAGCVVRWNPFEGCWDCPCHGSQFAVGGEALQGPAHRPLQDAD